MPGTTDEISKQSGEKQDAVRRWLRIMQDSKPRQCRVSTWKRTEGRGGPIKRVYSLGAGKDAPCRLLRQSGKVCSQRFRDRVKKEDVDKYEWRKAKRRARYWHFHALTKGDPMTRALFGR